VSRRIHVETWDPEYGSPMGQLAPDETHASVDPQVELAPADWRPLTPPDGTERARNLLFIDGVRRIDAIVWIEDGQGAPVRRGLCASYAAGVLRAAERAVVEQAEVRRALFCRAPGAAIDTKVGRFEMMACAEDELDQLSLGLQQRLRDLEIEVAAGLAVDADLVVIDGPLGGRAQVPGAVGYVKTHRVSYLPPELDAVVGQLAPGQRSPLFLTSTAFTRYSFYLRLPGPVAHPWSGITRIEAPGDLRAAEAVELADRCALTLPAYASVPHKDPRAPQNLFPIGGLERELRHRLGDAALVQRALRTAVV
jgi:hypothetical protein